MFTPLLRRFGLIIGAVLAGAWLPASAEAQQAPQQATSRPNVIIFLADDK